MIPKLMKSLIERRILLSDILLDYNGINQATLNIEHKNIEHRYGTNSLSLEWPI
jgi:hypothetical protein